MTQRDPHRPEFNYNPHTPVSQSYPPLPPPAPVLYEMPSEGTVYEMPITQSPPSFSKPFHAQPEKFSRKFEAPPLDPYYAQNPPKTPKGVPKQFEDEKKG